jgi:hypothetical protein
VQLKIVGWLVAAVFLPVAAAAAPPAVTLNDVSVGVHGAMQSSIGLAQILIAGGGWPQAIQLLDRVISIDPENPEAWFMLGLARRGEGDERSAADAFAQVSKLEPSQARPLLELGKSLTEIREFERAREAFNQALKIADNRTVRRNIRKYLAMINQNREFTYWASGRMQPDSNPGVASGQKVVTIGGVPFVLNNPPQAKGGYGLGADIGVRYAPWLGDHLRLVTELDYDGVHFFHACCSDETVGVASGPGWWWNGLHVVSQAYARYRLYDGSGYSTEEGLRVETGIDHPLYALSVGGEGGPSRLIGPDIYGSAARGFISIDVPLTPVITAGITFRYERDAYPVPSQSFNSKAVETRLSFLGPWSLPVNTWAGLLGRNYDGPTLTSNGTRTDQFRAVVISVELDFLTLWGVSPTVGVSYQTQTSHDPLGRFNRIQALLGVTKMF